MKKHILAFLPLLPVLLIFLELGLGFQIGKISPLEPIRILLNNFSEDVHFTINNSAILGMAITGFGLFLYVNFLVKYTTFSMLLPRILYFGSPTNKKIFLQTILENTQYKNIFSLCRFYILAFRVLNNKNFSLSDEKLAILDTPKNIKNKIEQLNVIFKRHIGKENFVKNVEWQENEYIQFFINKAELTSEEVIKKFNTIAKEVEKLFSNTHFEAGVRIHSEKFTEIIVLIFNKQTLWETRKLDLERMYLQAGELLLGFYQKISRGVKKLDYTIFSKHLNHIIVSASSRSGKDAFLSNITFSLLWNIKNFKNMELHFFDTKGVDGAYLENMRSYGVYRYKHIAEYTKIFAKLVEEMRKNAKVIEHYSNIYTYNEKHPNNPIKERFIVINEFLSLNASLPVRELNELLGYVVTLTSEGAGFGYKVIIMSQTMRKDSSTALSSVLANIKTRFILKSFQQDEVRINTRGLSDEDFMRIANMKLYNCFHIEDNEIKQEFKAYLLEQEVLKEWIVKNFEGITSEIFPEKIQDYYNFAKKNEGISLREATETFHLTRAEWDKFVKILKERNEIQRLPNNAIVWKKKEG